MANWDSYTQKTTPADADTLMIKDTAGGVNKRTPFSGVWNWIVGKLTSAVISQLETTNKSIVPAINELNSKTLFNLSSALLTDADDVKNSEPYRFYVHRYAPDTLNSPYKQDPPIGTDSGVIISYFSSVNYGVQLAIPVNRSILIMRGYSQGAYSNWAQV